MTEIMKGKFVYGMVKVGERGQIVIPKEAREQFDIKPGDQILVVGDIKKGLAIVKADIMKDLALKILGTVNSVKPKSKKED